MTIGCLPRLPHPQLWTLLFSLYCAATRSDVTKFGNSLQLMTLNGWTELTEDCGLSASPKRSAGVSQVWLP